MLLRVLLPVGVGLSVLFTVVIASARGFEVPPPPVNWQIVHNYFDDERQRYTTVIMNADGSAVQPLHHAGQPLLEMDCSPDGAYLAFLSAGRLYRVRADGSALIDVGHFGPRGFGRQEIVMRDDGSILTYDQDKTLRHIDPASGTVVTLTADAGAQVGRITGTVVNPYAIFLMRGAVASGSGAALRLDVRGLDVLTLSQSVNGLSWSPGYDMVTYMRRLGRGSTEIFTLHDRRRGLTLPVPTIRNLQHSPTWSPDGQMLVMQLGWRSAERPLVTVAFETMTVQRLPVPTGRLTHVCFLAARPAGLAE